MSTIEIRPAFRRRFRAVTRQVWSLHVGRGVGRTTAVAASLLAATAAVDYFLELSWPIRAALLVVCAAIVAVLAVRWIVRPARAWNRARVASELEGLFPRLGQRLRTATQHGGRPDNELIRDGVAPGMVAALEEETAEKFKPLPYEAALPVRPALVWAGTALCCVAVLAVLAMHDPEWQIAMRRMTLAPAAYTSLSASASADQVYEGANVEIRATLFGRARPELVLHVRETGDSGWSTQTMDAADGEYTAQLFKLRETTEFFVSAGPERTSVQQIVVRHPLKLVATRVEVTAPAYTGLAVATHDDGSFSAVQGSTARIQIDFDRNPVAATLVVKDRAKPAAPPRRIEMTVEKQRVWAELLLTADVEYTVEAHDADGVPAVANRHRVRVTTDQPPTVWFDAPSESMEVHTLAELLMRARARDDFGVTRIGIAFQINNEEERSLVLEEVDQPHQREALAEEILMLEQFLLTQKDCVAYYAFAEDNRPDAPQRTTTDLRFIDIRPFQRIYRLFDAPEGGMPGPQRDLIFLDEVIARQRFNLNQTIRLETRSRVRIDVAQVDRIAAFENKLATQTHDLADFLIGLGVDGAAILSQAEEAMLSAVDSLREAKFDTAINQERDALRFLMEARETVQQALPKQSRAVRAKARAFDRLQRQKLRRKNEKAETLPQIAEELAKLAGEEDEVARMLAIPGKKGESTEGSGGGKPDDPKKKPTAPDKNDPDDPMKKDPGAGRKMADKNGKGGEDPLQERQDDIAGRATAIDKEAVTAKGLTDLAKKRIADAAKEANAGADALGQRDRPTARKEVDRARENFRLAAKQVAALAAEEVAQQIAAARDLANDVALETAPTDGTKSVGAGKSEEDKKKVLGLGDAAEQTKTLKDVLEQIAGSGSEGSAEASRKVAALLKQEDLAAAIKRMEKPGAGKDCGERQDLAERFAALGQKLDQVYRETIAPRLEEIARLEREANELEQRAAAADDATSWRRLRQQGAQLVERLEGAGLGDLANKDLRGALRTAALEAGKELFSRGITATHARLAAKLQEFVAGDRFTTGNEAVPPEYKDLVDRYLRALSAGRTK
ncbi:MAG TPA: DUF4175 family protein [Gemmataceae bacterium]|nr:DUF4175 family protein [Gemmataceae bacterium]